MYNVVVLGGGVVGLSTAINIQRLLPSIKVKIISEHFGQETTSWGAGAIFRPTEEYLPGIDKERARKWIRDGWNFYSSLALSEAAGRAGMTVAPSFMLSQTPITEPLYKDIVYTFHELTPDEMKRLQFDKHFKYGYQVTTIVITTKKYLAWLMERFIENGGETEERKIENMNEFVGVFDVIVNCSGLGSRDLFNDKSVYPIRGQLVRVQAPWIKCCIYTDGDAYLIPNDTVLAVGGCRQENDYNRRITSEDTAGIMMRCCKIFPALKGAKIDHEWVGLRPVRSPLRMEKEILKFDDKQLTVIHNYGHCSDGIVLSWGTSLEAADLVKTCIKKASKL